MLRALSLSLVIIVSFAMLVLSAPVFAADPLDPVCNGTAGSASTACRSRTTENPLLGPTGIITRVIQLIVLFTGVASVIVIMIGGFKYLVSAGDSAKVSNAKDTILYAVIGLVVAVVAQAIVSLVLRRL